MGFTEALGVERCLFLWGLVPIGFTAAAAAAAAAAEAESSWLGKAASRREGFANWKTGEADGEKGSELVGLYRQLGPTILSELC